MDEILDKARQYRENLHRPVDWADYEYFKQILLGKGFFGFESKLADVLEL